MSDALTASVIVALRALRDGEPCDPTVVPAWTVIPPNGLVSGSRWRLSPAGAAVLDLVETIDRESAEAIKRVAESIVADKWNATAAFQDRAIKAEAENARMNVLLNASVHESARIQTERDELRCLLDDERARHRQTARECGDALAELTRLRPLAPILAEMERAESIHGPLPALYSSRLLSAYAEDLEAQARWDLGEGAASSMAILCEEVGELVRAETPEQIREEAVQVAAVAMRVALAAGR